MPLRFPMLLGSHRDAVELNYIASLLQTTSDKSYRADGTIAAIDVRRYLTSRHGFRVDTAVLEKEILHTLAGTRQRQSPVLPEEEQQQQDDDADAETETNIRSKASNNTTTTGSKSAKKGGGKFNARKVRYHGGPVQRQQQQLEEMAAAADVSYMDLCQLASLILAPELVQLQRQYVANNNKDKKSFTADPLENPLALMKLLLEVMVEELAFVTPPDELSKIVQIDPKTRGVTLLLDHKSLQRLFRAVGEDPAHWTRQDLDQMLQMAAAGAGSCEMMDGEEKTQEFKKKGDEDEEHGRQQLKEVRLDAAALLRALTSDVCLYPIERTEEMTTHYQDVMCTVKHRQEEQQQQEEESKNLEVDANTKENSYRQSADPTTVKETTHNNDVVADSNNDTDNHDVDTVLNRQQNVVTFAETADDATETVPKPELRHATSDSSDKGLLLTNYLHISKSTLMDTLRPPLTLGTSAERIFTLASLDQAADTQKSLLWAVTGWLTLVATAFAYFLGSYEEEFDYQTNLPSLDCSRPDDYSFSEWGCKILNSIILWTQVFIEVSLIGGTFMILSQLGNNVYSGERNIWITTLYSLVGIATVTIVCILSYFYEVDTFIFDTTRDRNASHVATFCLGCLMVIIQTMELVRLFLPLKRFGRRLQQICAPDAFKREQSTKHAASFKAGRMLSNAVGCFLGDKFDQHDEVDSDSQMRSTNHSKGDDNSPTIEEKEIYQDVHAPLVKRLASLVHEIDERRRRDAAEGIVKRSGGLQAGAYVYYHDHMDETVMTGGIWYFWRNILGSRSVIREEGLWLSVRLITANLAQWIVAIAVIPSLFYVLYRVNEENEDFDELQEEEGIEDTDAIPGIFVGGVAAILVSWLTALIYIPMAYSTVLQMRSGYLGNFFDQSFQLFRKSTDRATALFGSALWGSIFSAALAWGIVGGLIFVFLWDDIRDEVLNATAVVIGFATTFAIKWLALKVFRRFYFGGLYRRKPAAANIFHLILECWNIALASGFMLLRIGRLLLTSVFYIGRMDTPFLAEGVGLVFNSPLDNYPMAFRRDLSVHEAHRHPWIERLGMMYMMKLQHGAKFGQRGGAAWRMIFVFTLLPWLRKHRQMAPIYFDETEDVESIVDDSDDEAYGLESADEFQEELRSSLKIMQRRRSALASSQTASHMLSENESLVAKNLALQRQVMELRSLLGRERRNSTIQANAVRMSFARSSLRHPISSPNL